MGKRVACDCDGLQSTGVFEIGGDWLTLKSTFGEHRVRLGIANPRRLAAKLLRNLCLKAAANRTPHDLEPCRLSSVSDRAQELVDVQRDKVIAIPSDDPQRATEERVLDQMVTNARAIDAAVQVLAPPDNNGAKASTAIKCEGAT